MRWKLWLLGLFVAMAAVAGNVWAQDEGVPPEDGTADEGTVDPALDDEASTPEGVQRVTERLAEKYHVTTETVTELRDQQMGFGEIDNALTLANQLPGGATSENIDQIMAMRTEQHMGWGQIANEVDTTLGKAKQAPIQEPTPPEPTAEAPPTTGGEAGTTGATTGAASLERSGSAGQSGKSKKGESVGFSGGAGGGESVERPGGTGYGSRGTPPSSQGALRGGGLGHGGAGGSGGVGSSSTRGKSSSAPGHNR